MKIAFLSVALLLLLVVVDVRESEQFATLCSNCADGMRKLIESSSATLFRPPPTSPQPGGSSGGPPAPPPPSPVESSAEGEESGARGGGPLFSYGGGGAPRDKAFITRFFQRICEGYTGVEHCLERCTDRDNNAANFMNAYTGLRFICKERKQEFFDALPCLSEQEQQAMARCSVEIAQSQETTSLFTNSIVNREFHSIQMRFGSLCRDLNDMIHCMEPVIRARCGPTATSLLLQFVGLEFSSFEKLYAQLGFDQPLPAACRALSKQAAAVQQQQQTGSSSARGRIGGGAKTRGKSVWAALGQPQQQPPAQSPSRHSSSSSAADRNHDDDEEGGGGGSSSAFGALLFGGGRNGVYRRTSPLFTLLLFSSLSVVLCMLFVVQQWCS